MRDHGDLHRYTGRGAALVRCSAVAGLPILGSWQAHLHRTIVSGTVG